jgi:hypothetical protein
MARGSANVTSIRAKTESTAPTGWKCPCCGAGNAPTTPTCACASLRRLVTPEELGGRWSTPVETVRRWCRSGRLPAKKIAKGKGGWRIDVAEAERWWSGLP